jgi:hypothetical protein
VKAVFQGCALDGISFLYRTLPLPESAAANQRTKLVHQTHHGENPIRKCNGRAV